MAVTDLTIVTYGPLTHVLNNVNIESYTCTPQMAEDGMVVKGAEYHITGTAILNAEDWEAMKNALGRMSNRLLSATMVNGAAELVDLTSAKSNIGGPYCTMTGNQVIGTKLALVRFDLRDEMNMNLSLACNGPPVVAHTWTQAMSLDGAGKITRTINGVLRVARGSGKNTTTPATVSSWNNRTPIADLFRKAIIPPPPAIGWRRESQSFAYDNHSTALIYSIVDKQHAHDLPDGVRVGDMDFMYERSANDPGVANLTMTVDLEADLGQSLKPNTTPNRMLVQAALALAKTRINAGYGSMIITRVAITEKDMLSRYAIHFVLEAQVYAGATSANNAAIVPLAYMVGQKFAVTRTEGRAVSPYGPSVQLTAGDEPTLGSYYMVPHYIGNAINAMDCEGSGGNMPQASMNTVTDANVYGSIVVTVFDSTDGLPEANAVFKGEQSNTVEQPDNTGANTEQEPTYTQIVSHNVSLTNVSYDSGMVRLSVMYTSGADLLFQTRKPHVRIRERVEVSRANTPPAKLYRSMPTQAYLLGEDWNVTYGKYDAQGNRLYTGVYEREYALYDNGQEGAQGFYTSIAGYAGVVRRWQAPVATVSATMSPIGTSASQNSGLSVFGATGDNNQYGVSAEAWQT